MKTLFVLLLTLSTTHAAPATKAAAPAKETASSAAPLKTTGGNVGFLAVGKPSMLKIHGTADAPEANLSVEKSALSGTVSIDLDKFDTGIAMRNEHMKEKYLETKTYPKAVLTLKNLPVDAGFEKSLNAPEKPFTGDLALHGQSKPVSGTYSVENGKLKAKFGLKLSDYGIQIPNYLGVKVAEDVAVDSELNLAK